MPSDRREGSSPSVPKSLTNKKMYPNYIENRKALGYKCLIDTQCGNRLVLITDSSVVFVKSVTLDGKREIFKSRVRFS